MINYNRIAAMFEWMATHHADVLHVADPTNQGLATARFARYHEWKEMEKSSLGYPRVVMPALATGSKDYNYSGHHTDMKRVILRIYDNVGRYTNTHGFDAGANAIVFCEGIAEGFRAKLIDWRDNGNCGGWCDVIQLLDLETMPYRHVGEAELGGGCFGVEITFVFKASVDVSVDGAKWV